MRFRKDYRPFRRGFTLIELLVVVAIIAVLTAILLPALSTAREQARKAICGSNLRVLGTAVMYYAADYSDWMGRTAYALSYPYRLNYAGTVPQGKDYNSYLPYVFHSKVDQADIRTSGQVLQVFACPSNSEVTEDKTMVVNFSDTFWVNYDWIANGYCGYIFLNNFPLYPSKIFGPKVDSVNGSASLIQDFIVTQNPWFYFRRNHPENGGNVLSMDLSVAYRADQWRSFEELISPSRGCHYLADTTTNAKVED